MQDKIFRFLSWLSTAAIIANTFFFMQPRYSDRILIGVGVNYFCSALLFLVLGVHAIKRWERIKRLSPSKCLSTIYTDASPRFIFSLHLSHRGFYSKSIGVFVFLCAFIPFFVYWQLFFGAQAMPFPTGLLLPLLIHMQFTSFFEFLVFHALEKA